MRRYSQTALLLLPLLLWAEGLHAQTPVSVTAQIAYRSSYLFAGIPFGDDIARPQATVAAGAFTLNGAAVYDHGIDDVNEWDLWGDYYRQLSPAVGAFVGAGLYVFKIADQWEPTPELYGGLVYGGSVTTTLYVAHDFDLGDGTHALLSLSRDVALGSSGLSLGLLANLDYNHEYYVESSGLAYLDVGASLAIPVGALTLTPMILVQQGIGDGFPDEEVFMATASYTF